MNPLTPLLMLRKASLGLSTARYYLELCYYVAPDPEARREITSLVNTAYLKLGILINSLDVKPTPKK